ncbi:hypothetical protein E5F05_11910 [Deinococcus metallilatus]|uniref:Na+/H+ antiporter NhaA n=1 Tax=Deinococcus metallilatus TaxID=1211322 RepID=A0AAJ5F473_9DEIO|nr:hypothetical protein [Deinococcus metallilatus]MBB5295259.1 Na+/H+ antiporter NhaA [Deinococcus metallilatus]QBY08580.1 hypothetical protein E5F05_11910 [Deinococcus metallilatus]RXJ10842.1 hypothetical protein ERJ73_10735 [Deinococcus metallilatus]TLK22177.1 hypothetical protein FCS05_18170 [Deinococcus metallilatus]
MLRAAFWLTALVFLPAGLFLYFLSPGVASVVGVSPLWLARAAGGLVVAWSVFLLAASTRPDSLSAFALAAGNLLTVAALVPPVLRLGDALPAPLRTALLTLATVLTLTAVTGILAAPSRRSHL